MSRLKCSFLLYFLFSSFFVSAQITAKIILDKFPKLANSEKVFIAGNFNGWDPAKTSMQYDENLQQWIVNINLPKADRIAFKFTKGNWNAVQCDESGEDVGNNEISILKDSTWIFSVKGWKTDFFNSKKNESTATAQVQILDSAFGMPQLSTNRRIWMYLPKGYATSKKMYPVLYMHDGQNLFDQLSSGFGEWGIDECLDSLIDQGYPPSIVVGIDNGADRLQEYNPYDHDKFGKGKGEAYVKFIVETLKPYIDAHYRTVKDRNATIIAGSSMGGIISCYAFLQYPETFGKAGIFSPAFWVSPQINDLTNKDRKTLLGKLFFYAGALEDDEMVPNMEKIADQIAEHTGTTACVIVDPSGKHNEKAWQKWFPQFYKWIMGDGNNVIIKP